jgi:hypothetical protein
MTEVLAEGVWCEVCQYFEEESEWDGNRCLACGCDREVHRDVNVVTK